MDLIFFLFGCEDLQLTPDEERALSEDLQVTAENIVDHEGSRLIRPFERPFIELSERIPEFAGFWIDDGNLVLHLTSTEEAQQHMQSVVNYLNEIKEYMEFDASRAVANEVEYSFEELRNWRDMLFSPVFSLDGVVMLALSEKMNQIRIGVENERYIENVHKIVEVLEIPLEAMHIEIRQRPNLSQNIQEDSIRPILGGDRYKSSGS